MLLVKVYVTTDKLCIALINTCAALILTLVLLQLNFMSLIMYCATIVKIYVTTDKLCIAYYNYVLCHYS